eukprot:4092228-Ditylum_brightwellii.AAC.1
MALRATNDNNDNEDAISKAPIRFNRRFLRRLKPVALAFLTAAISNNAKNNLNAPHRLLTTPPAAQASGP